MRPEIRADPVRETRTGSAAEPLAVVAGLGVVVVMLDVVVMVAVMRRAVIGAVLGLCHAAERGEGDRHGRAEQGDALCREDRHGPQAARAPVGDSIGHWS